MNKYFAWGAAILIAAAVGSLIAALPAQDAFCKVCGAHEQVQPYSLRFTSLILFRSHRVEATPFSALMVEKGLVASHRHQWLAPQLVPNPMDTFGAPVLESLEFISAPRVVHFMRDVADYADPVSVAKWQELVLQPQYSYVIDGALHYRRVPEEGFADRTKFLSWWGDNSFAVYNRLREVTEPD